MSTLQASLRVHDSFRALHRAINAARYRVHKPGCDCGKMKAVPYELGFTILPDTRRSRQQHLYRFPIKGSYEENKKEAELLLHKELFPPNESDESTSFKISCAACLLADEPNGFVGIASSRKSTVEYVRDRASLESTAESSWHHDHALFSCVLPATAISTMLRAKTRSQCEQAQDSVMACLDLQRGDAVLNGCSITIGHHLKIMLDLAKNDNADYWFVMVQQEREDEIVLDLPGGKRHLGETSLECAIRECREETSLLVDSSWVQGILQHDKEPGNHYFRMQPPAEQLDETEGVTQKMSELKLRTGESNSHGVEKTEKEKTVVTER